MNAHASELCAMAGNDYYRTRHAVLRDAAAEIERLEQERDRLRKVADKARELEDYLSKNVGTTDDWPIDLVARDSESANKLAGLLENLCESLKGIQ